MSQSSAVRVEPQVIDGVTTYLWFPNSLIFTKDDGKQARLDDTRGPAGFPGLDDLRELSGRDLAVAIALCEHAIERLKAEKERRA